MSHQPETPFDNLESSHRYIAMLAEAITEAQADVDAQIQLAQVEKADRRREALQLVAYNLIKLNTHINASRRILNDLRSFRRLLLEERTLPFAAADRMNGSATLTGD